MDQIEREVDFPAPPEEVWEAVTDAAWLADEASLELRPGGDAWFRCGDRIRTGWVEEVSAPDRLAFWWSEENGQASRVEIVLTPLAGGATRLRVTEARPLEVLDLVGIPLPGSGGGRAYGPALVAA